MTDDERTEAALDGIDEWAANRRAAGEVPEPGVMRSVADGAVVELREVTADTVRAVMLLQVAPAQRGFVAPNAVSIAQAMYAPLGWFRANYADEVPVGFALLSLDEAKPAYYLWRFMVDARFQGLGYGRAAIQLIAEHVRGLPGATSLMVSWVPAPGGPEPFYRGLGFEPTGYVHEGEVVGRLALTPPEGVSA